ncbi:hypothetical protein [Malaciobacter mytili]|uniref:hypothetical protein n=1 Tax=Malaciobacter mytili TaxID=603050 RepID=UPI003A853F8A
MIIIRILLTSSLFLLVYVLYDVISIFNSFSYSITNSFATNKINLYFYALLAIFVVVEVTKFFNTDKRQTFLMHYDYYIKILNFALLLLCLFVIQQNIVLDSIKSLKITEDNINKKIEIIKREQNRLFESQLNNKNAELEILRTLVLQKKQLVKFQEININFLKNEIKTIENFKIALENKVLEKK